MTARVRQRKAAKASAPEPAADPGKTTQTRGFGALVAISTTVTALVGLVSDVLVPLAPLTKYLAIGAGVALVVCLVPASVPPRVDQIGRRRIGGLWNVARILPDKVGPHVHNVGRRILGNYWRWPAVEFLAVSMAVLIAANLLTSSAPPGGLAGAAIPGVRSFQESMGVVAAHVTTIKNDTGAIREDTGAIKEDTGQIKEDLGEIRDNLGEPEQETSVDPRKELANLGVAWTTTAFVEAMKSNDLRTVELFLAGGMSPDVMHKEASAIIFVLQPGMTQSHLPVLELLAERGFDFDATLTDYYIMPSYSDRLPVTFENSDPPAQIYGYFEGSALLWVVMVASYFGPTEHDHETLNFLLEQGVDTRLAKAYMEATESWNGDNWPFDAVSDLLLGVSPAP